jgi:DNA-entry nuclease
MPYVEINNNIPFFDNSEITTEAYEKYSELDELGRARVAIACIEKGMDDVSRERLNVNPSGWKNTKYDGIDGSNLYNRCHLIANQLTGENNNERNLITGTRYMNTQGMARFENQVAEFVNNTNNHVMYRVTPMFEKDGLIARGVLMEAKSVEDKGQGILFNVFCYNVQPGIEIDYKTGNSKKENESNDIKATTKSVSLKSSNNEMESIDDNKKVQESYVLNTNTKKFHHTWCSSVNSMKSKNRKDYTGTREEVINKGYVPCKICYP